MTTPKELAEEETEPFREEFSFTKPWRELAEEFRRLAAKANEQSDSINALDNMFWTGKWRAFTQAAQMVEDKLG